MRDVWTPHDWRARDLSWHSRSDSDQAHRRSPSLVPRLRRLFILIAIWLGLLVWPTPQIGDFLSAQSTHLADTASGSVTRLVDSGLNSIPLPLGAADEVSSQHAFWQVGLAADSAPDHDTGIRTTIQIALPQQVSDQTTDYFWVGSYLSNGSFIQVGYYVPWFDTSHAGWFYCAFYANGREGPCKYGPLGSVSGTPARHTYALETTLSDAAGNPEWLVRLDSTIIGQFTWATGDTGTNAPVIYAESSGFAAHDSSSQLGPVDFSGLDVRPAGATAYVSAPHLRVVYSALNVCPPYGVATDEHGGALLGSGLSCPTRWTLLS